MEMYRKNFKKIAIAICIIIFLIIGVISVMRWWKRGENITASFLEAKSYYVEYEVFYNNSADQIVVREWYQAPHKYYQERSLNGEIEIQVWSNDAGTVWRNVSQDNVLEVAQYVPSTLWQAFSQLAGQPAFKQDNGYYLTISDSMIPYIKLECDKKGEPQKLYITNDSVNLQLFFRDYKLNLKIEESIIEPFVT